MIYCSGSLKGPVDEKWFDWLMDSISNLKDSEQTTLFGQHLFSISKGIHLFTEGQLQRYIEVAGQLMLHQLENSKTTVGNRIRDSFFTPSFIQGLYNHQSFSKSHANTYLTYLALYFDKLTREISLTSLDVLGSCYSSYAFGTIGFHLSNENPEDLLHVIQKMLDSVYAAQLSIQNEREHGGEVDAPLSSMQDKRLKGMLEHISNALGLCLGLYKLKDTPSHSISICLKSMRERVINGYNSPLVFEPLLLFIDDEIDKTLDVEHQYSMHCVARDWPPKNFPARAESDLTISRQDHLDEYQKIFSAYSKLHREAALELNELLHLENLFLVKDLSDDDFKYLVEHWSLVPHKAVEEILSELLTLSSVSDHYKASVLHELIYSDYYENKGLLSLRRPDISPSVFYLLADTIPLDISPEQEADFFRFLAVQALNLPPMQLKKLEHWHQLYQPRYIGAMSYEKKSHLGSIERLLSSISTRLLSDHYYPMLLNGNKVEPSLIAGALAFVIESIDHVDLKMLRNIGVAEALSASPLFYQGLVKHPSVYEMYLAELLMEKADLVLQTSEPVVKPNARNLL